MKACKFCGEVHRLKVVLKCMRGRDWRDRRPAAYIQCQKCKARGPLISTTLDKREQVHDDAVRLWDGALLESKGAAGLELFEKGEQ